MKTFRIACLLALSLSFITGAGAQTVYPVKPIRIVVPYPAGGGIDVMSRLLGQQLSQRLGQPVVIENKPGAGTIVAAESVARAAPDGHTLLMTTDATITINPHLYAKLPYDPVKDFVPITQLVSLNQLLLAHSDVAASNLKELISLAKSQPNKLNYASYGSGSQPHLAMEMLKSQAGIELTHVPYKGGPPAYSDLMGGQVEMMFQGLATAMPQILDGKLRVLAVGSAKRHPALPDVPTLAETLPGFVSVSWTGLVAPPKTPAAIVNKLQATIADALRQSDVGKGTKGFDVRDLIASTPAEATRFTLEEKERWGAIIRSTGTTAD